jgi:hypothetical protein
VGEAAVWDSCRCGRFGYQVGESVRVFKATCANCPTESSWFKTLVTLDEWGHSHLHWRLHKLIFGLSAITWTCVGKARHGAHCSDRNSRTGVIS